MTFYLIGFILRLSLLNKPIMIKEIIMVIKFLKIAIVCLCFSTKPLFAQDGTNVNLQDNYVNKTLIDVNKTLIYASASGEIEVVKLLLEAGADVNHQSKKGNTALMYASHNGHIEVVKLLLEAGAVADIQNNSGQTALSMARSRVSLGRDYRDYTDIVRLLREAGATE